VSYTPRPLPSSEASQAAIKKRKAKLSKRPGAKKVKAIPVKTQPSKVAPPPSESGLVKKVGVLKISWSKAKPGPQGMSEIELALAKPIGVSKKFCLLDVVASSHAPHATGVSLICAARVPSFDNLGDNSSPNCHKTPSPKRTIEKRTSSRKRRLKSIPLHRKRWLRSAPQCLVSHCTLSSVC
jgi:hypothetical protein